MLVKALAEMMGVTKQYMTEEFHFIHKGKLINPEVTVEEVGIEDQDFLVITPRLKGGNKDDRVGGRNKKEILEWRNMKTNGT